MAEEYKPGDGEVFTEEPEPYSITREPIPPKVQERRGLLIGLGITFVAIFLLQLGFALFLDATTWARVGPILSSFSTIIAGLLGVAGGYYFSGKD